MNNTANKDFILDCLDFKKQVLLNLYNTGFIIESRMNDFEERMYKARNFINSLPDETEEYSYPIKTINPKEIMKKFDLTIEQLR